MNYDLLNNNRVFMQGIVGTEPTFAHELYGEGFYEFMLEVERLSDYKDIIPITISEKLIKKEQLKKGQKIALNGQFRSYNKPEGERSRLMLTVFVRELIEPDETINSNIIEISGYLCKSPIYRTTPFNREICDLLVAVNRAYKKSDYLPAIAWGRNARFLKDCKIGDKVFVSGRIQSRSYQKKIGELVEEKVAYEISVSKVGIEETGGILDKMDYADEENMQNAE